MEDRLMGLYCSLSDSFLQEIRSDEFRDFFEKTLENSRCNIDAREKYISRKIDMEWVEALEDAVMAIDGILRHPGRFIKREENIVPIETAREIGPESVKHLSQHTNLIQSVQNGTVTPSKILSVNKEESFETYENRFIYTLLQQAMRFIELRVKVLNKDESVADRFDFGMTGDCLSGSDRINFEIRMNYTTPHEEYTGSSLPDSDISLLTDMQRVDRLKKIFSAFMCSPLIKKLQGCEPVRPPLTMTNMLKQNPNFRKCVDLWGFLCSYTKKGFEADFISNTAEPTEGEREDILAGILLQYIMLKKLSAASRERMEKQRAALEAERLAREAELKRLEQQRLAEIAAISRENLEKYRLVQLERQKEKEKNAKYRCLSRKKKKAAQKRDGVYGIKEKAG